jgi:hypothetical protein
VDFPSTPAKNAGVSRGIDHPVSGRKVFDVASHPQVAVKDLEPLLSQESTIVFGTQSGKIVQAKNLRVFQPSSQSMSQAAAYEPANPGNEYFHETKSSPRDIG